MRRAIDPEGSGVDAFLPGGLCGSRWSRSPSCRRGRRPDSTGRAATMPASRCSPAIPRCARRAATATARCRAWTFSYPGTAALGGSNLATCWLKNQVKPLVENRCCASGVKGAALVEMRPGPVENAIDRIGGDYRNFEIPANQDVAGLQAGLRRRQPLPRLVLRAAGLRRADGALLPQGQDHGAEAAAVLHVGRGAVGPAGRQATDGRIHRRIAQIPNSDRHDPGDDRASSGVRANAPAWP